MIELLVVVAIIVAITALAIPAFTAIRGGTDFTTQVYEIAGLLDQARAYATANNTYVLAGITEVSGAQDSSANPQASGTGRVAVALIASQSGTRPYQPYISSLTNWYQTYYGTGSAFIAVTNLMAFQNMHIVDLQYNGASASSTPSSGNMYRPTLTSYYCDLSNSKTTVAHFYWFGWPLGALMNRTNSPQYEFPVAVEFDPQGTARCIVSGQSTTYPDAVAPYLELGLQTAHGGGAAATSGTAGEVAAIQINGITGAVHIYRP